VHDQPQALDRSRAPTRIRRISRRLRRHDWLTVVVDLQVVVVGILLALQVGSWAQAREDRRLERLYLSRLKEDLQIELSRMEAAERFAKSRIDAARLLDRIARDPAHTVNPPGQVAWALETASWRSFPQINAFVYRELQSTGRMALLRSHALRRSLSEHYAALQHDARVGEDLSAQHRFDAAVAGLLDTEELEIIERVGGNSRQIEVTPERAAMLCRSFLRRSAAVAELPGLVQHHTFNLRVIGQMKLRANSIIQQIDAQR